MKMLFLFSTALQPGQPVFKRFEKIAAICQSNLSKLKQRPMKEGFGIRGANVLG